jgi:hypothetical protein
MMGDERASHVADWELERYHLGELPAEAMTRIQREVETSPELRERLQALAQADADLLARHPPAVVAAAIRERLQERPAPQVQRAPALRPALAAVLGLAVVGAGLTLLRPWETERPRGATAQNRVKGLKPQLTLYRQAGGEPEKLASGDLAAAGDVVQIAYRAAGQRYGVIVSADGRGSLTRHLPVRGTMAADLESAATVALENAFVLDDAPLYERFYFVTSSSPFQVSTVVEAVRAAHIAARSPGTIHLPPGLECSIFDLRKEAAS